MYFNIAFKNVKKSFKEYSIYFLTLIFAVCIFYSFNAIGSQKAMMHLSEKQNMYGDLMGNIISVLSVFIAVLLGGLIIYATNFLIKKRKKEFGIYMCLGMKKKKISKILVFETVIVGIISLIVGITVGVLFSQGLSFLSIKLFKVDFSEYRFIISFEAIIKTILYFVIIYLVVILFNVFIISRYKLVDLLYGSKKSESIKVTDPKRAIIILILSIVVISFAYYFVLKAGLDFTNFQFKISLVLGCIGTLLFFYGIASTLFYIIKNNKNIYLNKLNIFTTRQIVSKFNTNFISMTIICLMLFLTISSLSSVLSVKNNMEETLKLSTPFDATIMIKNLSNKDYKDILKENGYELGSHGENYKKLDIYETNFNSSKLLKKYTEDRDVNKYLENNQFINTLAISLSDYNNMRELKGEDKLTLGDNEVFIASNHKFMEPVVKKFMDNEKVISIDGEEYRIANSKLIEEAFFSSSKPGFSFVLIVNDKVLENCTVVQNIININFNEENKAEMEKLFHNKFTQWNENKNNEKKYVLNGGTIQDMYDESRGLSTIVIFIGLYLGIVFLLASTAILSLQQLSECSDSIDKYNALKKIGATKKLINKSILEQVAIFFMLPLILAIIHSIIAIRVINEYVSLIGKIDILMPSLITALIIIITYGGYFYATYLGYKNSIWN